MESCVSQEPHWRTCYKQEFSTCFVSRQIINIVLLKQDGISLFETKETINHVKVNTAVRHVKVINDSRNL
jgi:hypothetical protein